MSFIAAAAISAGASLIGGAMSSSAAGRAASAQADAANQAAALQAESSREQLALQREIYNQQRADIAPYRQAGLTAQNRLLTLLGLAPTADAMAPITQFDQPGYDRALDDYYARLDRMAAPQTAAMGGGPGQGPGYYINNPDESGPAQFWVSTAGEPGTTGAAPGMTMADIPMPTREQFTSTIPVDQLQVDPNAPDYGKYARDFSMQDFQEDPGYAFRLSEGLKALDRQAAARGGLISGAALKASQRYGQDMASQEYGNAFNRYQINRSNQLNPLMSITGYGQTATNTLGGYGSQYATGAANTMSTAAANQVNALGAAGQSRASGYVGQANALTGTASNLGNLYMQNQFMNRLFPSSGGGFSTADAANLMYNDTLPAWYS